jgi:hypothetical protein
MYQKLEIRQVNIISINSIIIERNASEHIDNKEIFNFALCFSPHVLHTHKHHHLSLQKVYSTWPHPESSLFLTLPKPLSYFIWRSKWSYWSPSHHLCLHHAPTLASRGAKLFNLLFGFHVCSLRMKEEALNVLILWSFLSVIFHHLEMNF